MISKEMKAELTAKFGKNAQDSGNPAVQVAILTARINGLREHFGTHIHDYHSNRGLLKMIGKRRSLLKYIKTNSAEDYSKLIQELGLRK